MTETPQKTPVVARIRNNFLTGVIIVAPILITFWLTWSLIRWADSWVKPYIPMRINPDSYLTFAVPGFGLLFAVIVLTLIGFLTKNLIGRSVVHYGESVMHRMPLVRSIYRALKQLFETVFSEKSTSFKKVGLLEYPGPGLWSLVFISTDAKGEIAAKLNADGVEMIAVFVAPTPVPTAGFMVFVPRSKVTMLDMNPEDGAKLLITAGLVTPDWQSKALPAPVMTPETVSQL